MAYAPPPGKNSLPARPPPSKGFRPAFGSSADSSQNPAPSYPSASHYAPGASPSVQAGQYGQPASLASRPQYGAQTQYPSAAQYAPSAYSGYTGTAPGVTAATHNYPYASQPTSQAPHQQQQQQPMSYAASSYATPQIQNPFPLPGTASSNFDASEAAQIAEWQSAYSGTPQLGKDGKAVASVAEATKPDTPVAAANSDKKKTVVRQGGGKKWTDETLLEWDPSHLRLFVGNLAGETTDESLLKAFSRWKSVQKARVIRDKRTTKSKGYGFVSFSDADDFFQAAKEMNGKYIQSHPVVVRKANTEIKVTNAKEKGKGGKNSGHKNNGKGAGQQGAGGYEPSLGPMAGGGVTKPGQKTKNGLRLLG
ncbi:hypothetical protein HIM_08000 [Hirsutella minnesotensis 3608]|uniref:RRM domain-containing protein n=1 Tax=Hirsutella minnesotensis 3608 TaxID=1043627 RepID=A0A0F7ZHH3_9HYPO|nr:hypothetical protein HIM_08000 [Hirsutella minnesotensis 3608]